MMVILYLKEAIAGQFLSDGLKFRLRFGGVKKPKSRAW